MNKEIDEDKTQVKSSSDQRKAGRPSKSTSERSAPVTNPVPQAQKESRSDQEQEGTQNPAGDTRDVSREPVDHVDQPTKK
ncbi:MAG: hypothetical protein V4628_17930 [Pseudomonadota bacterium]